MNRMVPAFSFILGIGIRSFFDIGISFVGLFLSISLCLFLSDYFYRNNLNKDIKLKRVAAIFLAISVGMIWFDIRTGENNIELENNVGKTVSFSAVISEEPEEKENSTNLIVSFSDSKILLRNNKFPRYKYGDKLDILGELKRPENFDKSFDYETYLAKDEIFYLMDRPKIKLISSGNGNFTKNILFEIKNTFVNSIVSVFPEPHSSLLSGLLFGSKGSLGNDWLEKFRIVGLSHIIVLSGYNLTIIADATMKVISKVFSRNISIFVGSFSIVLFSIMTGGGASTVRATIMALIIMLARVTGRMYDAGYALFVAGFLMVIYNPKILVFDLSFQLSFLATLGLIYISPKIKEKITFLPEKFQFRELVATTLGAQITTAPLIAYKMGTFSLVSLPANLLVVVFIPATMFFGFLASVFSFLNFYLAIPFVAVAWALLSYEVFIVDIFSSISFASISVGFESLIFAIFLFFIVLFFIKRIDKDKNIFIIDGERWIIEELK